MQDSHGMDNLTTTMVYAMNVPQDDFLAISPRNKGPSVQRSRKLAGPVKREFGDMAQMAPDSDCEIVAVKQSPANTTKPRKRTNADCEIIAVQPIKKRVKVEQRSPKTPKPATLTKTPTLKTPTKIPETPTKTVKTETPTRTLTPKPKTLTLKTTKIPETPTKIAKKTPTPRPHIDLTNIESESDDEILALPLPCTPASTIHDLPVITSQRTSPSASRPQTANVVRGQSQFGARNIRQQFVRDGISERAIQPTLHRLRARIDAGECTHLAGDYDSSGITLLDRGALGERAMSTELMRRGIKTQAQVDNFWNNLTVEYSRMAGFSFPTLSMRVKAQNDFLEESLEHESVAEKLTPAQQLKLWMQEEADSATDSDQSSRADRTDSATLQASPDHGQSLADRADSETLQAAPDHGKLTTAQPARKGSIAPNLGKARKPVMRSRRLDRFYAQFLKKVKKMADDT